MVIRSLIGVSIFFSALVYANPSAELSAVRDALSKGEVTKALDAGKKIAPNQPEWADKLEAFLRFYLSKGDGQEAWRVIQIARRTRAVSSSQWLDYERLALLRAEACPLSLATPDDKQGRARVYLLNAAVYRLLPSNLLLSAGGSKIAVSNERQEFTLLAPGLIPYLSDIATSKLLRGQGCRIQKAQLHTPTDLAKAELEELLGYLDSAAAKQMPDAERFLVLIRALDLAGNKDLHKEALARELRLQLLSFINLKWGDFPDDERQWLFIQIFGARRLEDVPSEQRQEAQRIGMQALHAPDASPYWLAVIDLENLDAHERQKLLSLTEKRGTFEGRPWVLYQLALTQYQLGKTSEALTVLRRLLVEQEEQVDQTLQDACLDLAAQIFSEHRLEQRTQGAVEAAVPAKLWIGLLQKAQMSAALQGHIKDFRQLDFIRSHSRHLSGYEKGLDYELARSLARRDLSAFRSLLTRNKSTNRRTLLSFARTWVAMDRSESSKVNSWQPYAQALAETLNSLRVSGAEDFEEISDLIQILGTGNSERERGQQSVRKGVVKVGVAHWHHSSPRPASFVLQPPAVMPVRELFYIPDIKTDHGWTFSTAKH